MSQLHNATCDFVIQIGVTPPGYGYSNILKEMIRLWCHNPFSRAIVYTVQLVLNMSASNDCSNIGPSLQWYFNNLGSYKHYCFPFSWDIVWAAPLKTSSLLLTCRELECFVSSYFHLCRIKKSNVKCNTKWWCCS